jgi:hypothetical protein
MAEIIAGGPYVLFAGSLSFVSFISGENLGIKIISDLSSMSESPRFRVSIVTDVFFYLKWHGLTGITNLSIISGLQG